MRYVGVLGMFVCASVSSAQALVPQNPTMGQFGSYDYYLGAGYVAFGVSSAPSMEPLPGSFGPYSNSYSWLGANWSTGVSSMWSIAHTPTTTNVSGQVFLTASADAAAASATATNHSYAHISFVFMTTQPVSYTANWYSQTAAPFFGTAGYSVQGSFSPYPTTVMTTFTPMTNSGVLAAGLHTLSLAIDLTVSSAAGTAVYDGAGLAFDLQATVIPAPGGSALLGVGALALARRRRR